ncbi:hypothetical protein LCGC14_1663690 [marine sediment metagenome]|uniref:HNH domain-containing protein n=1 Tax=marine sediment metagenome TaxID=412755 RepID=A0A0F9K975_9ZZZZ|nr:hypothetical protein [bacterium]
MNKRLLSEEIKTRIGKKVHGRGKCYVCGCRISKRGMTIHHLEYIFNDIVHKNYKPRNDSNTLRYYTDLEPLTIENPKRFMYLCNPCHTSVEKLNRFGDKKLGRLLKARRLTKTRR